MHHRLILAGLAATGGLLTTAFLQVAVPLLVGRHGADAFTIGGFTFDPFTSRPAARASTPSLTQHSPPLLELGGGTALGLPLAIRTSRSTTPPAAPNWGASRATRRLPASSA